MQRNGFLILMPSLGLFFSVLSVCFIQFQCVDLCFILFYFIISLFSFFSQEVCFLMRDRNGVALDGGGDLEGGGEGETRTKTYYVRKKIDFQ